MGVVVGALVAIGVGPLSARCCGVGSKVVRARLRVVVDLWGSDEVAQAVEEERGPAPSHVVAPLAVEQPLEHAKRLREAHAVVFDVLPRQLSRSQVPKLFHVGPYRGQFLIANPLTASTISRELRFRSL